MQPRMAKVLFSPPYVCLLVGWLKKLWAGHCLSLRN